MTKLIPIIYMIGIFLLVLPSFIQFNKNIKIFLTNLSIWVSVILILLSFYYLYQYII